LSRFGRTLLAFGLALWTTGACTSVEEKRIRELLNEKGFGTRAQGNATFENYVTGGDLVTFLVDPTVLYSPGAEQLALLQAPQPVSIDGTILIPYIGPVQVLGLTERQLTALVTSQLGALFTHEIDIQARIMNAGKAYYAFGEFIAKGRIPMAKGDITALEAIATLGWTTFANVGRLRVVKPDAENPLVIEVNVREIIMTGNTAYNVPIYDNDILYLPPTFFGALARFLERLLAPFAIAVNVLFGAASVRSSYDVLTGQYSYYGYYRF
jgi:hypothetical protein